MIRKVCFSEPKKKRFMQTESVLQTKNRSGPAKNRFSVALDPNFFMRTVKTLIRLGGCPGWSESSLGAQDILLVLSCSGSFQNTFGFCVKLLGYDFHVSNTPNFRSKMAMPSAIKRVWERSKISLVTRKSVFWVCDQVRLKPAFSTTATS